MFTNKLVSPVRSQQRQAQFVLPIIYHYEILPHSTMFIWESIFSSEKVTPLLKFSQSAALTVLLLLEQLNMGGL